MGRKQGRTVSRVDLRIVTATNKALEVAVRDESFRADLYYRINLFPIRLPALRERKEDIPYFIRENRG